MAGYKGPLEFQTDEWAHGGNTEKKDGGVFIIVVKAADIDLVSIVSEVSMVTTWAGSKMEGLSVENFAGTAIFSFRTQRILKLSDPPLSFSNPFAK